MIEPVTLMETELAIRTAPPPAPPPPETLWRYRRCRFLRSPYEGNQVLATGKRPADSDVVGD